MRAKRKTQAEKLIEAAVDRAVGSALAGKQIPLLSIPKVYERAWYLVGNGMTAEHLAANLSVFASSIEIKA